MTGMRCGTIVLAAILSALFAGCSEEYFARRDSIVPGLGDAPAANAVTHVADPWPRNVGNKHIPGDGSRLSRAIERYESGPKEEGDSETTTITIEGVDIEGND